MTPSSNGQKKRVVTGLPSGARATSARATPKSKSSPPVERARQKRAGPARGIPHGEAYIENDIA